MWRILVVDDEENVAETLRAGLETLPDCQVRCAFSGGEAIGLMEVESFDLILTDYKMADTDGLTLIERIRKSDPQIKIIMLTAYGSRELREKAMRYHVQHFLEKPLALQEIREVVLRVLTSP